MTRQSPGDHPGVRFAPPALAQLRKEGLLAADLHFHTNHSDAFTPVRDAVRLARHRGVGLALTDHNEVSGVLEARRLAPEVLVVPGMEVTAQDGPHLLLYFYRHRELEEFHRREVARFKGRSPYLAIRRPTLELLEATRRYNCVVAAAHPYGYLFLSKGVGKGVEGGDVPPEALARLGAVEALNGSMSRGVNRRAAGLAAARRIPVVGGTDAHRLGDLGGVVTVAEASDLDGFLDAVARGQARVVGQEKHPLGKAATGALLTARFLPYAWPSLEVHYEQNLPRVQRWLRRRAQEDEDQDRQASG